MGIINNNSDIGVINLSIVGVVIIESIFMHYTLKAFQKKYFLLLLLCSISSFWAIVDYSELNKKVQCFNNKISDYLAGVCWILYTQSYLLFLSNYYKNLLQRWQIKLCYIMNFVNFLSQCTWNIFYLIDIRIDKKARDIIVLTSENTSATLTVVSEGFLSSCILLFILKFALKPIPKGIKSMMVKVIIIIVLMAILDVTVIYLEYSGRENQAYFTKPLLLSFKFLIEILILGHCKVTLMILSGIENW
jgi:hypothetical protein